MSSSDPLLLGAEIGGTKLQLGLGTGRGQILALERLGVERQGGAPGVLRQVETGLDRLLAGAGVARGSIAGVGVGFGGPVDAREGRVVLSHQIAGWDNFALKAWIQDTTGCRQVRVENDADTAALGEATLGAGAGRSPVLYVNSGSGVGGGLILDGQIYRGGSGVGAVEFGHLVIDLAATDDERTRWPALVTGTVESFASGWSIARQVEDKLEATEKKAGNGLGDLLKKLAGPSESLSVKSIGEAALAGDELARLVLARAARAMGQGLAQAVTLLAPQSVVLGGGVSLLPERLWLAPIRQEMDQRVFGPFRGTYEVASARLGEAVVLQGALVLARDEAGRANGVERPARSGGDSPAVS